MRKLKPFRINRNSWHYRLNKHFFNEDSLWMAQWEARRNNFCSYWRATVFRTLAVLALAAVITFMVGAIVHLFMVDPVNTAISFAILIGVFATFISVLILAAFISDRTSRKPVNENPSLFVQRYRNYKSKICPSVQYDK